MALDKWEDEELKRMLHPAHNHGPSPCDCFPFVYLQEKIIDNQQATPDEPFSEVETIISEISSDLISRVFETRQE
jgi:hypothetical protein